MTVLAPARPRTNHAPGFWFVAVAFLSLMAFGTLPTPLWPLYQARNHFGPTEVTIAFAAMVLGAAVSFGMLGHLSDRFGRRRIIVPALLVAIVSALLMAFWPDLPGLIAGRVLTGVAVGMMASTATAYLSDLYREAYPDRAGSGLPVLVSTVANLGGLSLGPLVAGTFAQWLPAPLLTPYLVVAGIMTVLLVLVLSTPETVDTELTDDDRPARFALRPGHTTLFGTAAAIGFFSFALIGLFSAFAAIIVRGPLGITSIFVISLAPFAAFVASAVAQFLFSALGQHRQLVLGTVLFPVGLAITALSVYHPALATFFIGAVLSGAGGGVLFKGAVTQTAMAADPASRAGVLAAFFIIAYIGMGAPSIAFSIVIRYAALAPTLIGFGAVLSAGTIAAVVIAIRRSNRLAS